MQTIDNTLRLRTYTLGRGALRRQYVPSLVRAAPASLAALLMMFGMLTGQDAETGVVLLGVGATLVLIAVIITLVLQKTMKKVLLTSLKIDDQSVTWMSGKKVRNRIWRDDVRRISFTAGKIVIRPHGKSDRLRIPRKYFSKSEFSDIEEQLRLWEEVPTG